MNLAPLLRQQVQWTVRSSTNDRGDPSYAAPTTVPGRAVGKLKDVIAKDGEVVTASTQFTLLDEPAIGDLLDGREVIAVSTLVAFNGSTAGYSALTR